MAWFIFLFYIKKANFEAAEEVSVADLAWKMFKKSGEAGWKALIPIYNQIISREAQIGKV
mgnify:CR=1 FL=1